MHLNNIIRSPKTRAWVYGILIAAGPLLVFYGVFSEAELALWLGVASAALGNGLALANTPVKDGE
jgi:hypothetical protein